MTGNAGLFFVAWQLTCRGWNVMPTVRNSRGADMYAAQLDNEAAVIAVQSKALSKPADVPLGTNPENLRSHWWIITVGATGDDPVCFVMTLPEVKSAAVSNTNPKGQISWWLPRKAYDLPQYRDAWDRLIAARR